VGSSPTPRAKSWVSGVQTGSKLTLESVVELPLTVTFREGKEFFRDAEGRAEGVIDATFADITWDLERVT
jgi:hypothetical protein